MNFQPLNSGSVQQKGQAGALERGHKQRLSREAQVRCRSTASTVRASRAGGERVEYIRIH